MTVYHTDTLATRITAYLKGPLGLSFFIAWISATLCGVGTLIVAGWIQIGTRLIISITLGAIFMAVGFCILTLIWGNQVSSFDEVMVEFTIPVSFILARIIFYGLGFLDQTLTLIIVISLPFISLAWLKLGTKGSRRAFDTPVQHDTVPLVPSSKDSLFQTKGVVAAILVLFLLRLEYGVLRAFSEGSAVDENFLLISVFLLPIIIFALFIYVALKLARSIDVPLVIRWVLPVQLLAFALLYLDQSTGFQLAHTANSLASSSLQAFFWILLAKEAHRKPGSGVFFFACYLAGICLGMASGALLGTWMLSSGDINEALHVLPLMVCIIVALIMVLWGRAKSFGLELESGAHIKESKDASYNEDDSKNLMDRAMQSQTQRIAQLYSLSRREAEIIGYLLAGRNRPYIRDRLCISLNTVNTHIRNIFGKLDVHSQQELLDLAEREFPPRLS